MKTMNKKHLRKYLSVIFAFGLIAIVFYFFLNDIYRKHSFNHTYWTGFVYAVLCMGVQYKYYSKHKTLPILDDEINKANTTWKKIQVVILNVMMIIFVGFVCGRATNTLITQVVGENELSERFVVINKESSSGRHKYYSMHLAKLKDKNQTFDLYVSFATYHFLNTGDVVTFNINCSAFSCYINEKDIKLVVDVK